MTENHPTHEPGDWVITCFCGQKLRGETDVELLSNARNHIDEAHPERSDQTDEQLLARVESGLTESFVRAGGS